MPVNDRNIMVRAEGLTRKFGDFTAVDQISFEVARGEVFGFLGANGAGKTTAIRMLTGLLAPTEGTASVAGYDVYGDTEKIKRRIGYMSQKFSLYEDLSIRQNIRLYGGIYGLGDREIKEKIESLMKSIRLEEDSGKMIGELPLGWKQKLAFSVALLHDPDLVFLDEPTSGVDPVIRRQFWEEIYRVADEGTTFFVTTHYMDEAEYCDRVSIMVDGRIEALAAPERLKSDYGADDIEQVFIELVRG